MGIVLAIGTMAASAGIIAGTMSAGLLALDCKGKPEWRCPEPSPDDPENIPRLGPVAIYITNGHKEWPKLDMYEKAPIVVNDNEKKPRFETKDGREQLDKPILYRHYPAVAPNGQLVRLRRGRFGELHHCLRQLRCYALGNYITVSGNYAAHCGAGWGMSKNKVLGDKDPQCMWIDKYQTNGITVKGFTFDLVAEEKNTKKTHKDPDKYPNALSELCQPPFLQDQRIQHKRDGSTDAEDERLFEYYPGEFTSITAEPASKIDFGTRLIKSNLTYNSAVNMCQDQASKGPHFVSHHEKMYCDMTAKRLYSLCEADTTGTCFDDDQDALVERGGAAEFSVASVGAIKAATVKTFEKVSVWE
ncbi:hypothetical protein EDD36DRAFT_416041 [Exophiala viscosa]|uniref:Uncharacterized protein n=1 Tax=Exophiala viscosa TaxID=2486360 RepID=A0AAN6IJ66_9EURO|nr:hypothetical protein EDD36DRAFT_416041 [Exophiala viscosa]